MYPTNPNVNENVVPGVPLGVASQYHQHEHYDRHHHQQITAEGPWSSGLCGCCSDVENCCVTCWCPCITFGQITEIVDKGTTSCGVSGALYALLFYLTGCACCYSCFYRAKLRKQYNIAESPCGDCLVHCCCEECALCQEYRELKARGFDMSFGVGWHENMAKQSRGGAMPAPSAPMMEVGMKR